MLSGASRRAWARVVGLGAAMVGAASAAGNPPPPNDECAGAILIQCNSTVIADNSQATISPGDSWSCRIGGGMGAGSIWYKFVATHTSARVQTCASTGNADDSILQVFSGTCGSFVSIGCNDDGCNGWLSLVEVTGLTVGETYSIQLSSWTAASLGAYTLELICPRPTGIPGCSNPVASFTTADLPLSFTVDLTGTPPDPGPPTLPTCGTEPGLPAAWFEVEVTEAMMIEISTCGGTDVDTIISLYAGTCDSLVCIATNDDGCGRDRASRLDTILLPVTHDPRVYVRVAGRPGPPGLGEVNIALAAAILCGFNPPVPPQGAQVEDEPNCSGANDGCGRNVGFDPVELGRPVYGTIAHPINGSPDSDWYQFRLDRTQQVRIRVQSQFAARFGIMGVATPWPTGICAEFNGILNPIGFSAPTCQESEITATLRPGVHTFMIHQDATQAMTIPCGAPNSHYWFVVECIDDCGQGPACMAVPANAVQENEPDCGFPVDSVNGGCVVTPPLFSALQCGRPFYGTVGTDFAGWEVDTDWFQFTLNEPTEVTFTMQSEFSATFGVRAVFDFIPTPTGDCSELMWSMSHSAVAPAGCVPTNLTVNLGVGTWTVMLHPNQPVPCYGDNRYLLTMTFAGGCGGITDCNDNGIDDALEIAANPALDCFTPSATGGPPFAAGGPDGILDLCQCVADWNRDALVNSTDISSYIVSWLDSVVMGTDGADVDCSGTTNSSDISTFVVRWVGKVNNSEPHALCP